jgi:hypothetical protein
MARKPRGSLHHGRAPSSLKKPPIGPSAGAARVTGENTIVTIESGGVPMRNAIVRPRAPAHYAGEPSSNYVTSEAWRLYMYRK